MTRALDGYLAHRRDRGRGPQRVLHVMTRQRLHLARVKEEASFEEILDRYSVKTRGAGAKRMAQCPFHPDRRPSCSIHLERKVFYCFGCGAKGSVLDFVAQIENVSIHEAAERIEEMCRIRHDEAVTRRQKPTQNGHDEDSDRPLRPLPFRLTLDPGHPYLAGRHIGPDLAATFGLGYCSHGTMQGRICIPIHDACGVLVAYTGRWASDELPEGVPKYDLPRQFPKRRVLYNLHRVAGAEHLVLVEGYWSVFRLHVLDVAAVSLMGRTLSAEQETLLIESGVQRLTIMLDGDAPGRNATDELLPRLAEPLFCVRDPPSRANEAGHGARTVPSRSFLQSPLIEAAHDRGAPNPSYPKVRRTFFVLKRSLSSASASVERVGVGAVQRRSTCTRKRPSRAPPRTSHSTS